MFHKDRYKRTFFEEVLDISIYNISQIWYWIKSHTFYKYHLLDLRQPKDHKYPYRYGWCDVDKRMLYAMFNLLDFYISKEEPYDLSKDYSMEEINNDFILKEQYEILQEAKAIHFWWNVSRQNDLNLLDKISKALILASEKDKEKWINIFKTAENSFEYKTDEMIARLMKIRRSLWT